MKKILLILILLYSHPLMALDLSILLQADYYGDSEPTTSYESLRSRLYIMPKISGEIINNMLNFYISANLYYQPIGDETFIDSDKILREGYLRLHKGVFNLYLGQRFVNWGKVDFYSPINVINPLDTTVLSLDNTKEGRLPNLMADFLMNLRYDTTLELIYEPFLKPYFYPNEQMNIKESNFLVNVDATFYHEEIPYLSKEAHSIFIALNHWSYWFDLLISYSYYIDPYPDFDLSQITQETDTSGVYSKSIKIRGDAYNTYNRAHLIGLGIGTSLKGWGVDFESGLKITQDWLGDQVETKNSELVTNIQVNKTFFDKWFCQFNFIHRYIINHDVDLDSDLYSLVLSKLETEMRKRFLQPVPSSMYIVNHLHSYFIHETLYFALNSGLGFPIFNEDEVEYELEIYLAPRVAYSFTDLLKLEAGGDFYLQGEEAGYLGRNILKDNFYVRIKMEIDL